MERAIAGAGDLEGAVIPEVGLIADAANLLVACSLPFVAVALIWTRCLDVKRHRFVVALVLEKAAAENKQVLAIHDQGMALALRERPSKLK